ncbi:MAG TPA: flagellar biosynthetic protein FliR [Candidatus Eremiobacteraceae bacterium]
MIAQGSAELALGFARTAAFAAAMPLGRARAVPRIVRVVLAMSLTPIAAAVRAADTPPLHDVSALAVAALSAALQGAAVGLCATIVAGAAATAGGLIDSALASQPAPLRDVFGESGPMGSVCTSAFGWFFFGGAFTRLAEFCVATDHQVMSVSAIAALAGACTQTALAAAGPAIAAQAFAAVVAAGIARMAPRVNGMFLGAPIAALLVIASLLAGGGALLYALAAMAWRAALVGAPS